MWSVDWQAAYGWPAALGLTPPSAAAGALFADHQMPPALAGAKLGPAADAAANKRSPDLHDRYVHQFSCILLLVSRAVVIWRPSYKISMTILRLSYDNAKVTIDLRYYSQTSQVSFTKHLTKDARLFSGTIHL